MVRWLFKQISGYHGAIYRRLPMSRDLVSNIRLTVSAGLQLLLPRHSRVTESSVPSRRIRLKMERRRVTYGKIVIDFTE
jgi:hypothetical protein